MSVIIDAYNLMHAANIIGGGVGPGGLERARAALINFLAESLPEKEKGDCAVVFDSGKDAPPGLPNEYEERGLKIYFSRGYENADALIEELILRHSSPRQLTVVSSDHRVQRAANRRRARSVDADVWYAEVIRQRQQSSKPATKKSSKPVPRQSKDEVEYWTREFEKGGRMKDEG